MSNLYFDEQNFSFLTSLLGKDGCLSISSENVPYSADYYMAKVYDIFYSLKPKGQEISLMRKRDLIKVGALSELKKNYNYKSFVIAADVKKEYADAETMLLEAYKTIRGQEREKSWGCNVDFSMSLNETEDSKINGRLVGSLIPSDVFPVEMPDGKIILQMKNILDNKDVVRASVYHKILSDKYALDLRDLEHLFANKNASKRIFERFSEKAINERVKLSLINAMFGVSNFDSSKYAYKVNKGIIEDVYPLTFASSGENHKGKFSFEGLRYNSEFSYSDESYRQMVDHILENKKSQKYLNDSQIADLLLEIDSLNYEKLGENIEKTFGYELDNNYINRLDNAKENMASMLGKKLEDKLIRKVYSNKEEQALI